MSRPVCSTIKVDLATDGILVCRLDRPASLNALTTQDLRDLAALWTSLADDDEVRAVVITGTGDTFCAGGDIKEMRDGNLDVRKVAVSGFGGRSWKALAAVPQPVVAAVNGAAVGAGIFFPALADFAIAAESARFGDPHVQRGLVASGAGILTPLIGLRHAKQLMLLGDLIDAHRALEIGLVNKVVSNDEVLPEALDLARRLASYPADALRWTKRCMNRLAAADWDVAWEAELAYEALAASSDDHHRAVETFGSPT